MFLSQVEAGAIEALFGAEVELPSQLTGGSRNLRCPEHALVLAMFWRGISDYLQVRIGGSRGFGSNTRTRVRHSRRRRDDTEDATRWIFEQGRVDPWSFEWCCSILGFDPEWVRDRLLRLELRGVRRAS